MDSTAADLEEISLVEKKKLWRHRLQYVGQSVRTVCLRIPEAAAINSVWWAFGVLHCKVVFLLDCEEAF